MCTVTVVPGIGSVRLAVNRDEQRSRPAALSPEVRYFGHRAAILPLDPVSAGTWVAVNDAGLALTLLNAPGTPGAIPARSRGGIIPALLDSRTLAAAIDRALAINGAAYAPFRLVLVDGLEVGEVRSEGDRPRQGGRGGIPRHSQGGRGGIPRHSQGSRGGISRPMLVGRTALTTPMLFTSSGVGDELVQAPRRNLFADLLASADREAAQEAFHRHRWPERGHLSVCMEREDARTVSYTVVTLAPDHVLLAYHPDAPDQPGETCVRALKRGGAR
jgi:hypothetical protein